jgi:hypothetical protein
MKWYVDAGQGNRGKASLELDITFGFLLLLGFFETVCDDISQHLLDLLDGEILRELKIWLAVYVKQTLSKYLLDINLLDLQVVQDIGERFKG